MATVSRVLNHPQHVAEPTKEKILTVIKESEYTPNWFARGLNFNRTNSIGLIIPNMLNPGYMEIAKGIEDVAHKKGYMVLLCNAENDVNKEKKYVETIIQRKVDGIVLVSSMLDKEAVQDIINQNIPVVIIGENKEMDEGIPVVRIDCKNAANKAARHLCEIGYQKIAIVYGATPEIENQRKLQGYLQALHEESIPVNDQWILDAQNSIHGGYISGKKLINLEERPQAIFATSDLIAIGVMDAMKDFGLRVPEDIAVIGFDNIQMSSIVEPKLTTVAKPLHKMGVVGSRLLFDIMEGEPEEREKLSGEILLQSKLKIRKSCGHKERIGEMF